MSSNNFLLTQVSLFITDSSSNGVVVIRADKPELRIKFLVKFEVEDSVIAAVNGKM